MTSSPQPRPRLLRLAAAALAVGLLGVPLAPSPATAEPVESTVVGGPLLGRAGTVVQPGPSTPALPSGVSAAAWVVADLESGEVLAARNAHGRFLPASTLKTLTAVALIPELARGAIHRATFDDVNVEGSKVGLVPGESYRVDTLFLAMLVVSGNDAANSLASAAGGVAQTATLMNATARRLGALDTVARNPSGLDEPGQLTSAYDLALITRAGMAMPSYRTYVGTLRSRINAPGGRHFEIYNHNKLMTRYDGTTGGKTGYTVKARRTFVVTAERDGRELVVSLLRAETVNPDATKLLDWGFAAAGTVTPVGELVEPAEDEAGPIRPAGPPRADRSARNSGAGQLAAPATVVAVTSSDGVDVPWRLVAAVGAPTAGITGIALRRRVVRRRRYGRSTLRLDLPVR